MIKRSLPKLLSLSAVSRWFRWRISDKNAGKSDQQTRKKSLNKIGLQYCGMFRLDILNIGLMLLLLVQLDSIKDLVQKTVKSESKYKSFR